MKKFGWLGKNTKAVLMSEPYRAFCDQQAALAQGLQRDFSVFSQSGVLVKCAIDARVARIAACAKAVPVDADEATAQAAIEETNRLAESMRPIIQALENLCVLAKEL